MSLEKYITDRGFWYVHVTDTYGKTLKIVQSSSAMADCIWIGDTHLSREMVRKILPTLQGFAEGEAS